MPTVISPVRRASDESNNSGESSGVQNWFEQSNKRHAASLNRGIVDNDPPYFVRQHDSSNTSNAVSESSPNPQSGHVQSLGQRPPGFQDSATKGSSADDFRSVIDDLTIQNRKLKEKLRKYEATYSAPLEKDKLFEVKIHGLPAKKKRELEETLRSFAASIDGSSDSGSKLQPRGARHHTFVPSKNTSLSSSTSQPVDSAYVSVSNSGPTSTSTLNHTGTDRRAHNQQNTKEQKVQSFLQNIPEGLLPKHSLVMTERQKKKIVVGRLEQLFTGKKGSAIGSHSQPLQQQKVSESAAMADRAANSKRPSGEGVREAHILPYEMDVDTKIPMKLGDDSNHETNDFRGLSDSVADDSPESSLEQRPTRPLDLDPDRAQIPSDNVEYIRHLGLSTPNFERGLSGDVEADGDGWIYLNLLTNMAQLHIINVTPDFIRSAVADVSDRFQLSRDGRKVRWRGGTDGTRFSSDSGLSSGQNRSPADSDSMDDAERKRRKVDVRRFASVPIEISDRKASSLATQKHPLHYEPLFHHRGSSSDELTSYDESDSPFGYGYADESATGRVSRAPRLRSRGSHSMSGGRARRRHDGPIVFYSGAQFCTDLSGDRGIISTPLHETAVGKDGYSNHTQDALGCNSRERAPAIARTPSGSLLPFRPFKDYSKGPDILRNSETRSKTPDLIVDEDEASGLELSLDWPSSCPTPPTPLIEFSASGLGGTQPADHFAVRVETRRTVLDDHTEAKLSKYSAPGPNSRKFLHTIPKSSLETFQVSEAAKLKDAVTSRLASLSTSNPPKTQAAEDFPIQTEILSARFARLQPSALPAPLGYYATLSSDDSDSEISSSSDSFSGILALRGQKSFGPRSHRATSVYKPAPPEKMEDSGEMQDDEDDDVEDDDNDDESVDMLAPARQIDPNIVAEREEEFEMQASRRIMEELPAGSSAATVDGGSGFSSPGCEDSEDSESD